MGKVFVRMEDLQDGVETLETRSLEPSLHCPKPKGELMFRVRVSGVTEVARGDYSPIASPPLMVHGTSLQVVSPRVLSPLLVSPLVELPQVVTPQVVDDDKKLAGEYRDLLRKFGRDDAMNLWRAMKMLKVETGVIENKFNFSDSKLVKIIV